MTKPSFEENLQALEEILQELEHGELPLETALAKFEAGMQLIRRCNEQLDAVDRRVEIILRDANGRLTTQPFAPTEGNDLSGAG
jgi:exodeoxyribonuclease VII small subunit